MRKIPFICFSILLWANVSIGQLFPTIVSDGNGDPYMLLNGSRTLAWPWWAAYDAGFSNAVVEVSPIAIGGGVTSLVQTNDTSAIGGTTLFNNTNFLTPAAALLTYQPLLGFTPQGGSMNLTNWGNLGTNQLNLYLLTSEYDASWGGLPTNIFSLYTPTANLGALAFDNTVNSNLLTGHWNFGQIDGVPTLSQSDSNHWTGLLNLSQLAGGTIPSGVSVPASQLTGTIPSNWIPVCVLFSDANTNYIVGSGTVTNYSSYYVSSTSAYSINLISGLVTNNISGIYEIQFQFGDTTTANQYVAHVVVQTNSVSAGYPFRFTTGGAAVYASWILSLPQQTGISIYIYESAQNGYTNYTFTVKKLP